MRWVAVMNTERKARAKDLYNQAMVIVALRNHIDALEALAKELKYDQDGWVERCFKAEAKLAEKDKHILMRERVMDQRAM